MTEPVHERIDTSMRERSASHSLELDDLGKTDMFYVDLERYVGEVPASPKLSMLSRIGRHMKLSARSLPAFLGLRSPARDSATSSQRCPRHPPAEIATSGAMPAALREAEVNLPVILPHRRPTASREDGDASQREEIRPSSPAPAQASGWALPGALRVRARRGHCQPYSGTLPMVCCDCCCGRACDVLCVRVCAL